MTDANDLNSVFRGTPKLDKHSAKQEARALRAARTRAKALSPFRILLQVICLPVVTLILTVSVYTRTSPYEQADALRHLVALAGCSSAQTVGLAPAFEGEVGYHKRNDPDGNGIACEGARGARTKIVSGALEVPDGHGSGVSIASEDTDTAVTSISGAKFLRP